MLTLPSDTATTLATQEEDGSRSPNMREDGTAGHSITKMQSANIDEDMNGTPQGVKSMSTNLSLKI